LKFIEDGKQKSRYMEKYQIHKMFQSNLIEHMQLAVFQEKEYVYHQGDLLQGLYVFLTGEWKVYYSLENGKDAVFRLLNQPRIVGEIEFMLNSPATTTIQSTKLSYAFYLSYQQCRSLLKADAVFLLNISYNMAEALYITNNNASINQYYSPKSRIASFILSIEKDGHFSFNYKLLPGLTGMSDRHMFRILNELIQDGFIKKDGDFYTILDHDALEDISCEAYIYKI